MAVKKIDKEVQTALAKLEVDMVGVVLIETLKDGPTQKAVLELLPAVKSIVLYGATMSQPMAFSLRPSWGACPVYL